MLQNFYRNPLATVARVAQGVVLGIIVGWVFLDIGTGQNSMQDKTGGIFLMVMGQSFPVATAVIAVCMYFYLIIYLFIYLKLNVYLFI